MRRWSPMRSPELRPEIPDVLYTRSGDVAIAYQTFGDGPPNLVLVPTFSNLVFPWLNASWREMYEQFASFVRLIMLDKRGTGLSDRPRELGTLETRMDDIRAVLDAPDDPCTHARALRRFYARTDARPGGPDQGRPGARDRRELRDPVSRDSSRGRGIHFGEAGRACP